MNTDVLIFAVLTTGAVLIVTQLARLVRSSIQHRTIREAISRDNPAVPQLMTSMDEVPQPAGLDDDRIAFVLIAIGLALLGFGLIQGDPDDIRNLGGMALFPALVGGALLLRHYLARRRGDEA